MVRTLSFITALFLATGVHARTLDVGPGREFAAPSDAAKVQRDGDRIMIQPGEYFDCAVWTARGLVVEGVGDNSKVVITDKACGGKALFITQGADITIRNLTLTRARVPDGNGAGIRAEGPSLLVDHVRFINNQNGILGGGDGATAVVRNSDFVRNGTCEAACATACISGHYASVRIEGSRFSDTRQGHHIKSRARLTEVIGNTITDGPQGTASYLVEAPQRRQPGRARQHHGEGAQGREPWCGHHHRGRGRGPADPRDHHREQHFQKRRRLQHRVRREPHRHRSQPARQPTVGCSETPIRRRPRPMKAPAYLPLPPGEGRGEGNNTSWLIPILACLLTTAAHAKTLAVGPGQPFALPSQAVRAAAAGDTILIEPGEYYDCAITEQPLIIEGHGDGVVLTDKTCEGKAILVLRTNGATVRNLTLARARVEDGNGAGIRLEGNGLTIDRVRFVNNEVGILAGGTGRITITDSVFEGGGVGGAHPLAALFLNDGPALVVTRTRFAAGAAGKSAAGRR